MSKHDQTLAGLSRRSVLRGSSIALGGLLLSTWLPSMASQGAAAEATRDGRLGDKASSGFGAFVRVGHDGRVTVISPKIEMGQGTQTGIAMMVAEELEIGLDQVDLQEAPPDESLYYDPLLEFQGTGGSTATRATWEPLRRAGATARLLLIAAAAQQWRVDPALCRAENGRVLGPSGQSLGYGELVDAAANLPLPSVVPLKGPEQYKLLGTPARRLDTPAKVNGRARYTIDLQIPDMLVASTLTCPVHGGTLRNIDEGNARSIAGVRDIVRMDNAVAVTASNFWACQQALKALRIEWDYGSHRSVDSHRLDEALQAASHKDGALAKHEGDFAATLKKSHAVFDAVYEQPFLSHSPLEPMTCVVHVRPDACDLWVGTQVPVFAQKTAAEVTGLPPEKIAVHNQLIGGAFGRRLDVDFITQAVQIARQVSYPIKMIWSREEDMTHGMYRPHYVDRMHAALDDQGRPLGWEQRIAGGSVLARYTGMPLPEGVDADAVEVAIEPIYGLDSLKVHYIREEPQVIPVAWWRGVGPLRSTYVLESFIDELAHNAKADPVQYRLQLIKGHPRAEAVLRLVTEKAGWGSALPVGAGRGVAVSNVFGSYVATVVELQLEGDKGLRITRLISAIDCGIITNPTSVSAQIEGGTLFGLSAALFNEVLIENGQVQQTNFNTYRQIRMSDAPPVEVHLVRSLESPGGVGEAGTALIAPALVNALHAATGQRIRRLPLSRAGYYTV